MAPETAPIGVFDSGVGGLSVARAILRQLPHESIIYLADQAHVPYGSRPLEEVRKLAGGVARYLLDQGAKLIVVACNTASAAALHSLRRAFPRVPFVGMEPAVKPAAEETRSGTIGVLATPATFQGTLYAALLDRFARHVTILQDTCPGLVAQIESGNLTGPEPRGILEEALRPMLIAGVDTLVLGCTHYPFVIPLIEQVAGPEVRVIDPAPAVARQTGRVLTARGLLNPGPGHGQVRLLTTGDPDRFQALLPHLLAPADLGDAPNSLSSLLAPIQITWVGGKLIEVRPG